MTYRYLMPKDGAELARCPSCAGCTQIPCVCGHCGQGFKGDQEDVTCLRCKGVGYVHARTGKLYIEPRTIDADPPSRSLPAVQRATR